MSCDGEGRNEIQRKKRVKHISTKIYRPSKDMYAKYLNMNPPRFPPTIIHTRLRVPFDGPPPKYKWKPKTLHLNRDKMRSKKNPVGRITKKVKWYQSTNPVLRRKNIGKGNPTKQHVKRKIYRTTKQFLPSTKSVFKYTVAPRKPHPINARITYPAKTLPIRTTTIKPQRSKSIHLFNPINDYVLSTEPATTRASVFIPVPVLNEVIIDLEKPMWPKTTMNPIPIANNKPVHSVFQSTTPLPWPRVFTPRPTKRSQPLPSIILIRPRPRPKPKTTFPPIMLHQTTMPQIIVPPVFPALFEEAPRLPILKNNDVKRIRILKTTQSPTDTQKTTSTAQATFQPTVAPHTTTKQSDQTKRRDTDDNDSVNIKPLQESSTKSLEPVTRYVSVEKTSTQGTLTSVSMIDLTHNITTLILDVLAKSYTKFPTSTGQVNMISSTELSPAISTEIPTSTFKPILTTFKPIVTTFKPIVTTFKPIVTTEMATARHISIPSGLPIDFSHLFEVREEKTTTKTSMSEHSTQTPTSSTKSPLVISEYVTMSAPVQSTSTVGTPATLKTSVTTTSEIPTTTITEVPSTTKSEIPTTTTTTEVPTTTTTEVPTTTTTEVPSTTATTTEEPTTTTTEGPTTTTTEVHTTTTSEKHSTTTTTEVPATTIMEVPTTTTAEVPTTTTTSAKVPPTTSTKTTEIPTTTFSKIPISSPLNLPDTTTTPNFITEGPEIIERGDKIPTTTEQIHMKHSLKVMGIPLYLPMIGENQPTTPETRTIKGVFVHIPVTTELTSDQNDRNSLNITLSSNNKTEFLTTRSTIENDEQTSTMLTSSDITTLLSTSSPEELTTEKSISEESTIISTTTENQTEIPATSPLEESNTISPTPYSNVPTEILEIYSTEKAAIAPSTSTPLPTSTTLKSTTASSTTLSTTDLPTDETLDSSTTPITINTSTLSSTTEKDLDTSTFPSNSSTELFNITQKVTTTRTTQELFSTTRIISNTPTTTDSEMNMTQTIVATTNTSTTTDSEMNTTPKIAATTNTSTTTDSEMNMTPTIVATTNTSTTTDSEMNTTPKIAATTNTSTTTDSEMNTTPTIAATTNTSTTTDSEMVTTPTIAGTTNISITTDSEMITTPTIATLTNTSTTTDSEMITTSTIAATALTTSFDRPTTTTSGQTTISKNPTTEVKMMFPDHVIRLFPSSTMKPANMVPHNCITMGCPKGRACLSDQNTLCFKGEKASTCLCKPGCSHENMYIELGQPVVMDRCGNLCYCGKGGLTACTKIPCEKSRYVITTPNPFKPVEFKPDVKDRGPTRGDSPYFYVDNTKSKSIKVHGLHFPDQLLAWLSPFSSEFRESLPSSGIKAISIENLFKT
ncbi:unnamed protein product [Mytilus coruscus]|uniref:Uncharacterized protein n=1 Tax=Mytilus coruscus TaxID=42192 RepID=A0A6J8BNR2_MYTCO|nr:unnamed protein product [Mytilus coruscus]